MDQDEREQIERVLRRIPHAAWQGLLARPEGAVLAHRRSTVRACLRDLGRLPHGAPAGPVNDVIDLLGQRLLSDPSLGWFLRHQLLLSLPSSKWNLLAERYRAFAGKRAGVLHGLATQQAKGSEVMATYWQRGSAWSVAFCEAFGLPPILATRHNERLPLDEFVEPGIRLGSLHDFQVEVYEKIVALLSDGRGRAALLSLPTGAGKTRVAVDALCDHLAMQSLRRRPRDLVLWIAQSNELQLQAWNCFRQVWQSPPGDHRVGRSLPLSLLRAWGGRSVDTLTIGEGPTVIIAGIAQLHAWLRHRSDFYETFPRGRLAATVVDEAHGLITPSHRDVLVALGLRAQHRWAMPASAAPVIGLTATPWRSSEPQTDSLQGYFQQSLLTPAQLGDSPIATLQERGILSRVRWEKLPFAGAPALTDSEQQKLEVFHDLPAEYLGRLGGVDRRNATIIERLLRLSKRSRALVFACSVEHAEVLTLLLNRISGRDVAAVVTGHTPRTERADAIDRFRAGDSLRFLCNVGVLTTGFDAPQANVVCITRPTMSAALYEQMVGRGLRGPMNGGTATCRVLDVQDEGLPAGIMSYQRVLAAWSAVGDS